MSSEAFVTLATNDGYGLGALVLAQSIRQIGTKRNLVVLVSNHLSDLIRQTLETTFDEVILVEELNSNDKEHLSLLARPELGITFTKINAWLLVQYTKCVFLDADCVVLRNIDDLFDREELSAAPDAGWPDCFNSGVFVFQPSKETFTKLMLYASQQNASFDGGDQGLLNGFFSNWRSGDISRHLPFTYNVTANAFYSYLPAVTRFRNDIHVVHFAGALKPWQLSYNPQSGQLSGNLGGQSDIQRDFLLSWWTVMHQRVWPQISQFNQQSDSTNKSSIGGEGQFEGQFVDSLNYGSLTTDKGIELGSVAHRRAWEAGHIDYYGRDSFSNIQDQLERNIGQHPQQYHPSQQRQTTPDKTTTTTTTTTITTILKSSMKETTPPPETTNLPNGTTAPAPLLQTTTFLQSSVSESTTTPAPLSQPTTLLKISVKESTTEPLPVSHTTSVLKSSLKESTTAPPPLSQTTTLLKSSLKESITEPPPVTQTTSLLKTSLKESTPPPLQQTTNLPKNVLQEHTTNLPETSQSLLGSTLATENKSSSNEHEANWTVKSTIVTAYTQGVGDHAGPTLVSKTVTETSASSASDVPTVTSTKYKSDPTDLSGLNITGNGTSARSVASPSSTTTANGNRVNK